MNALGTLHRVSVESSVSKSVFRRPVLRMLPIWMLQISGLLNFFYEIVASPKVIVFPLSLVTH